MKVYSLLMLVFCLLLTGGEAYAGDLSADEILDKALEQKGLGFSSGVVKARFSVKKGDREEVKEVVIEASKKDDAQSARVTMLAPADAAGEAYLFIGKPDTEDDVYLYLPAFKETRKLSGQNKKGAFLGTHLSYRDLESRDLEEANSTRGEDESVGEHLCYVIHSTPKDASSSDYARATTWVRQSDMMPLRVFFYDDSDALVKRLFSEVISSEGSHTYVKKMSVYVESGDSTLIEITEVDFDSELPAQTFSKDALGL